jgi:hypothetical protein
VPQGINNAFRAADCGEYRQAARVVAAKLKTKRAATYACLKPPAASKERSQPREASEQNIHNG